MAIKITVQQEPITKVSITPDPQVQVNTDKYIYLKGLSGKSPYINSETNTWMVYNDDTKEWIDTEIVAGLTQDKFFIIDCGDSVRNMEA